VEKKTFLHETLDRAISLLKSVQLVDPALRLELLLHDEDLLDGHGDHAVQRLVRLHVLAAFQREGLAVGEDADVVAVER
jgi:hypothetical protein